MVAEDSPPILSQESTRTSSDQRLRATLLRMELLSDVAARLLSGDDPDLDVLPKLYRALEAHLRVDAGFGFLVAELHEGLRLVFHSGIDEQTARDCHRLDFGQAICGTVAATREAMHVVHIQDTDDPRAALVRGMGTRLRVRAAYRGQPALRHLVVRQPPIG